jgi:hypothetical protein
MEHGLVAAHVALQRGEHVVLHGHVLNVRAFLDG